VATLEDVISQAKAAILAAGPRIAETQAQTVLALSTYRIQNQGLAGARYSGTVVPTWFFAKNAFNAGGRAYIKANKKGTYQGFKQALGLPSDYVSLTLTGRMFRSLTTLPASVSGTVFSSRIAAADEGSAKVVQYNIVRYGDFLKPTDAEASEVQAVGQAEVDKIMKQFFQ
jgi:hypothetical protein